MHVVEKQIRSLEITDVDGLDPVRVQLEQIGEVKGSITIVCFGNSWHRYWPAMSGKAVEQFFCDSDNEYLIGCLAAGLNSQIDDYDALAKKTRAQITVLRSEGLLNKEQSRDLWKACADIPNGPLWSEPTLIAVYGENYLHDLVIPQKDNPEYLYLSRIVDAVKGAINQTESPQVKAMESAA